MLNCLLSQSLLNPNPTKTLIKEYKSNGIKNKESTIQYPFHLILNQYYYYNSNLPNLENQNGLYFPKGFGFISSLLFQYHGKHLTLTAEPRILNIHKYPISIPNKEKSFSILNDVPLKDAYRKSINNFSNG